MKQATTKATQSGVIRASREQPFVSLEALMRDTARSFA
jgi:hypothetical protein